MAPLRALPGVAKVYFHMIFCFFCFREMIFPENPTFSSKSWNFSEKGEKTAKVATLTWSPE